MTKTILRCIRGEDAAAIAEFCADRDLAWMTSRIPHPYTLQMAEEFCTSCQSRAGRNWAITEDGETLVGIIGSSVESGAADMGYWIGAPFARRGHATRALMQIIPRMFEEPEISRLTACVYQDNPASARVLLKAGFKQGADCTGESLARGPGTYPTWTFALDRMTWDAAR